MERVNLDTTLNASELSEARAFFQRIQFHQEKNEFDRFETMIYEGNLIIYRQVSVKLLQAFRVLSKAVISQLRNFATSPQNLARVFVRLSALFAATAAVEPPTTIERVTMYADFLKVYIYKISLESKKDENPLFEKVLELTLDLVLYGGFEANFTTTIAQLPNVYIPPNSSINRNNTSNVVTPVGSSSSLCRRESSEKEDLGLTLLSPDDIDVSKSFLGPSGGGGSVGGGKSMFVSPDDL